MRVLPAREMIRSTPRTRIVRLGLADHPFLFTAGQAVMVGVHGGAVRTTYSIASSPGQTARSNALELLVLIDDSREPSPHLERLRPGDLVDVEGPFGTFVLPRDIEERDILFVAGGTGIAPLRSMLWDTIERGAPNRLALIFSARSADEFAFESELRRLGTERRLDLRLTITREALGWLGPRGRIDSALIQSVIRTVDTRCVLCGPPAMIDTVSTLLTAAGVSGEKIQTETFAA